jgi:hypothetical protein
MRNENTPALRDSLELIARQLDRCGEAWLIGGSCGLLLQGVDIGKQPRDIDLYVDQSAVPIVHERLREWMTDGPQYSETPIYRSTLSHYDVAGHTLEVVGGFEVEALDCFYAVPAGLLEKYAEEAHVGTGRMKLMPLAHELLFNLLRQRPDRYRAVAAAMRAKPEKHNPALRELLRRGRWSEGILRQVQSALEGRAWRDR